MEQRHKINHVTFGYSLLELILVVGILVVLLAVGAVSLSTGIDRSRARGGAQSCQAALAWAQIGVLWGGGESSVKFDATGIAVTHDRGAWGG